MFAYCLAHVWRVCLPLLSKIVVIGSVAELEKYAGRKITDLHRGMVVAAIIVEATNSRSRFAFCDRIDRRHFDSVEEGQGHVASHQGSVRCKHNRVSSLL
jgi:hypothetical protein